MRSVSFISFCMLTLWIVAEIIFGPQNVSGQSLNGYGYGTGSVTGNLRPGAQSFIVASGNAKLQMVSHTDVSPEFGFLCLQVGGGEKDRDCWIFLYRHGGANELVREIQFELYTRGKESLGIVKFPKFKKPVEIHVVNLNDKPAHAEVAFGDKESDVNPGGVFLVDLTKADFEVVQLVLDRVLERKRSCSTHGVHEFSVAATKGLMKGDIGTKKLAARATDESPFIQKFIEKFQEDSLFDDDVSVWDPKGPPKRGVPAQ